ncbi:hypothetical protein K438DRAFT_2131103 [Mycena galopus ATCC 62051]|nr:hypothetical protein K438DRAFT_2131103 [Mycena galopus ATCC 62051]
MPDLQKLGDKCGNRRFPSLGPLSPSRRYEEPDQCIVLLVHVLAGFECFNHTKRTWLVLWEAAVVIELSPWAMVIYPSALFYHFSIDIHDIDFVTTEEDVWPMPQNSHPIVAGDEEG